MVNSNDVNRDNPAGYPVEDWHEVQPKEAPVREIVSNVEIIDPAPGALWLRIGVVLVILALIGTWLYFRV